MADSKDVAARFVAAFNAHDEGALLSVHADNIKFEAPGGVHLNNTHDATAYALRWIKGFPNGKMTVRHEITSGPWVIQEITMEGTNAGAIEGPMGTVKATGKHISVKAVQLLRVEHDRIAEARLYWDQLETMNQLGLMPVPATV